MGAAEPAAIGVSLGDSEGKFEEGNFEGSRLGEFDGWSDGELDAVGRDDELGAIDGISESDGRFDGKGLGKGLGTPVSVSTREGVMDGLAGGGVAAGAIKVLNGRETMVASPKIVGVVVLVVAGGFEVEPCGLDFDMVWKSDRNGTTTGCFVTRAAENSTFVLTTKRMLTSNAVSCSQRGIVSTLMCRVVSVVSPDPRPQTCLKLQHRFCTMYQTQGRRQTIYELLVFVGIIQ